MARPRPKSRANPQVSPKLEAAALEAIERFSRVLAHTGISPSKMSSAFRKACEKIPRALIRKARRESAEMIDASHILTVWFSDPLYLDPRGVPVALPVHGDAPSMEALVHRVDRSLDPTEVVRYLVRAGALRRTGKRYAPQTRAIFLRKMGGPGRLHGVRTLIGMLRNLEHNGRPESEAQYWFQRTAENPHLPVRARGQMDGKLEHFGMDLLKSMDAEMRVAELAAQGGEPTVRFGIGIYRFEDEPDPPLVEVPRKRRAIRSKRRRGRARRRRS